ncbi:MAG: tetratricopeptide repeat protein [Candidatus Acidiferrales bacterium]
MRARNAIAVWILPVFVLLFPALGALAQPPVPDYSFPQENPVSPVKGPITGTVHLPPGEDFNEPVLVKLETSTGFLMSQVWTKKSGRFEFYDVACGSYVLAVDVAGYYPIRRLVDHSYEPAEGLLLQLIVDESQAANRSEAVVSLKTLLVPEAAREELEKGMKAAAEKKAERAIRHFEKAIELHPDYDDAYVQLALAQLQRSKFAEAQRVAEQALARNDRNVGAHAVLGVALREVGNRQESAAALQRAVEIDDSSWFSQLELGRTLLELRRVEEAYLHLIRAHELNPEAPTVHLNLYNAHILRNDYRAAVAELDEFLKLFPDHPQAEPARKQRRALTADLARRQP